VRWSLLGFVDTLSAMGAIAAHNEYAYRCAATMEAAQCQSTFSMVQSA
jgi:hypothetical protein